MLLYGPPLIKKIVSQKAGGYAPDAKGVNAPLHTN